MTSFEQSINL